jgi:hypothetical protein
LLKFFQQRDQMMDTAVGLLRARFQQIVKLSVPADEFLNREHKQFLVWPVTLKKTPQRGE